VRHTEGVDHDSRVRVEIMGPGKYENVGKSQAVLIMNDPIVSTRTRILLRSQACPPVVACMHQVLIEDAAACMCCGAARCLRATRQATLGDALNEAKDLATLALAQFSAAEPSQALHSLDRCLALLRSGRLAAGGGGDGRAVATEEAAALCSLCLVYAAVGRPAADVQAVRAEAMRRYTAVGSSM
jgi:hypothetical protein